MNEKPVECRLEDIKLGQKMKFNLTITESMVEDFARLSGDYNPLHMNEKYASTTSFNKRVCHGMLLASFFSRLVGMYLPGKNSLYFTQFLKFISPCFVNDEIIVEGEVLDKSIATRIVTLKTVITDNHGKHLIEGEAKVIVRK